MTKVYYAHHCWKYGTIIEAWEETLIKETFPSCRTFNPSRMVDQNETESEIMARCLRAVKDCDILVFSTVSGMIGRGVKTEIDVAIKNNIPVYVIEADKVKKIKSVSFSEIPDNHPRVYAAVAYEIE